MADGSHARRAPRSIAVVGLACRFPDADDPAGLLDVVLTGRRSFRRIPYARLDLAEYYHADRAISDATYSTRAALIEGWRFDRTAFGVSAEAYRAADPANWLALETAGRSLAAAGLPAGTGLDRDRTGVIIGNTLAGEVSRANALRVRWPYVRRVLAGALSDEEIPASQADRVLRRAESSYLAPFPAPGPYSLAGSMPATIAATISSYFGLRGISHAVDSACSSSLDAVVSACAALVAGELDAAIAGGVDLSLDPLELIGLAKAGLLATADVRVYDQNPTGYLPGEGCGMLVLMRTPDARAAGLPVYAEILGWGASAGGSPTDMQSEASSQLLAMRRAYDRAAVDPADITFFEGNGTSTALADHAELSALSAIRAGARRGAALGSVKANIGHAKAAAGAASLIKTVLALSTGIVPPTTGADRPHELLAGGDARLTLPDGPTEWAAGPRLAAVSAAGLGGTNVHVVLRHEPSGRARQDRWLRSVPLLARAAARGETGDAAQRKLTAGPEPMPFLLHAPDRYALGRMLARVAEVAEGLSDGEFVDLACALGRDAEKQGRARIAIVAARQQQLAAMARQAMSMLPLLAGRLLAIRDGVFAAEATDGRVTLLLSGDPSASVHAVQSGTTDGEEAAGPALTMAVNRCFDIVRWLDLVDANVTAAVGHGVGALVGLAWAGVLGESEVIEIAELRARFLLRTGGRDLHRTSSATGQNASRGANSAALRAAIEQKFRLGPPRRRLISTMTGTEIGSLAEAIDLICSGFSYAGRLDEAVAEGAEGATLLLETGPGRTLSEAAADVSKVPAISLQSWAGDPGSAVRAAAALFAAGALGEPQALFAGLPSRPIDVWRTPVFLSNPCQALPQRVPRQRQAGPAENLPLRRPAAAGGFLGAPVAEPAAGFLAAPVAEAAGIDSGGTIGSDSPGNGANGDDTQPMTWDTPGLAAAGDAAGEQAGASTTTTEQAQRRDEGTDSTLARLRAEVERRLPPRALIAAVTSRPSAAAAHSAAAAYSGAAEPAEPASSAEPAKPAEPARPAEPDAAEPGDEVVVALSDSDDVVDGLAAWTRCFTEELRPLRRPVTPAATQPWRMFAAARSSTLTELSGVVTADPTAARTLAIIEDPADGRSRAAAVQAAKDAIGTGELVVLTTSRGFTGFFASLHAEHPSVGITVLRVPPEGISPAAALTFAVAEPGEFRELVVGPAGTAARPVPTEIELPRSGEFPLGSDDVVLISRGTRGAALALAKVLACCGNGVAIIGRAGAYDDSKLVAGLEELRSAGARVGYEVIDVRDAASVTAAVRRIQDRLGPVTAIAHGTGLDGYVPVSEITEPGGTARLGDEAATLDRLVAAIPDGQLRLIITLGTVAGRYGLSGAGQHALTSAALASRAAQLANGRSDCRALHVDLPAWSDGGLGDRPGLAAELAEGGTAPMDAGTASRLLLRLLTSPHLLTASGLHPSFAVHSRVDGLATGPAGGITAAELAAAGLPRGGRFLREVAVHYPGVELVCSAAVSLATDPYLADYRADGLPVLPPTLALEALAEAASVLAGQPVRRATNVALDLPVLVPPGGEAIVRVCALRDGATIVTALRCADSSYRVDHARAEFSCAAEPRESPQAATAASVALQQLVAAPAGLVDGAELYGPVCFQTGRFRRVALLPEITARSGRALARGADDQPWFAAGDDLAGTGLLLGSPGLADAALQVLQACAPHRRVRAAACESVQFSGRAAEGPVEIRAVARPARPSGAANGAAGRVRQLAVPARREESGQEDVSGQEGVTGRAALQRTMTPAEAADLQAAERRPMTRKARLAVRRLRAEPVPAPDTADATAAGTPGIGRRTAGPANASLATQRWDVEAVDVTGQLLVSWRGIRLHDCGPLPHNGAWPPALLSVYLERMAADLALGDGVRVMVSCGQPDGAAAQLPDSVPRQAPSPEDRAAPAAGRAGRAGPERRATNSATAPGTGLLTGFGLSLRAPVPVACGWAALEPNHRHHELAAPLTLACTQLRTELAEPADVLAARLDAVSASLTMAGLATSQHQLKVARATSDGWALLVAGPVRIASAVVDLSGVPAPVAIALLTGAANHDEERTAAGRPGTAGEAPASRPGPRAADRAARAGRKIAASARAAARGRDNAATMPAG